MPRARARLALEKPQHLVVGTLDQAGRLRRVDAEDQRGIPLRSSGGGPQGLRSCDEGDELSVHPIGQSGGRLTSENRLHPLGPEDVEEERKVDAVAAPPRIGDSQSNE